MKLEEEIRAAVEQQYSFSAETWRAFATELLSELDRLQASSDALEDWLRVRWGQSCALSTDALKARSLSFMTYGAHVMAFAETMRKVRELGLTEDE